MRKNAKKATREDSPWEGPRALPRLIGHVEARERFMQAFHRGVYPHGWLIAGPLGTGKATLAYHLAAEVLATRSSITAEHVATHIKAGTHPDLWVLEAGPGKELAVEEVRQVRHFLQLTPSLGAYRIVLIDSVDTLNAHGANALLKSLEEPPADCIFLLVCHRRARLLPTLYSRTTVLPMAGLRPEEAAMIVSRSLPELTREEKAILACLSGNAPGVMCSYAMLPEWLSLLEIWPSALMKGVGIKLWQQLDPIIASGEANVATLLMLWRSLLQLALRWYAGGRAESFLPPQYIEWSGQYHPEQLLQMEAALGDALAQLLGLKMEPRATIATVLYQCQGLVVSNDVMSS